MRLGAPCVGTGHLLVGLLLEGGTAAGRLAAAGVGLEQAGRRFVSEERAGAGRAGPWEGAAPVMALARREAQRLRHDCIGAEHILLALLQEEGGVAAGALRRLGVEVRAIRGRVEADARPGA